MGTAPRTESRRRGRLAGVRARLGALRARLRRPVRRQAGVALLIVTVTIALLGATIGDFAYNSRVDLEAAANSRDMLRAEYMARSAMQLGQLLVAVQGGLYKQLPEQMRDAIVITDFAGFLAQAAVTTAVSATMRARRRIMYGLNSLRCWQLTNLP